MLRVITLLSLLVSSLLVPGLLAPPSAAIAQESDADTFIVQAEDLFLTGINAAREAEGLTPVVQNHELRDVARGWAQSMATADTLSHNPSYSTQYSGEWSGMAENVGVSRGRTDVERVVASLDEAFLNSPGHRRNIMGDFNQVGIGVVANGTSFWVTVNFLQGPVPAQPVEESFASDDFQAPRAYYGRGLR